MKMRNFIKLILSLFICLALFVNVLSAEKSSKNLLKKTKAKNRNLNKRTEKFYNGEEGEVDDNGDLVIEKDVFEDSTLSDDSSSGSSARSG